MNETEFSNADVQKTTCATQGRHLTRLTRSVCHMYLCMEGMRTCKDFFSACCSLCWLAHSDIYSVDEGNERDFTFYSFSMSTTTEALFPCVSRCLMFGIHNRDLFCLELHLGIMCLPGEQYDNASVKNLKFVQRDTNKCNWLCTEDFLVSVSHSLCQLLHEM